MSKKIGMGGFLFCDPLVFYQATDKNATHASVMLKVVNLHRSELSPHAPKLTSGHSVFRDLRNFENSQIEDSVSFRDFLKKFKKHLQRLGLRIALPVDRLLTASDYRYFGNWTYFRSLVKGLDAQPYFEDWKSWSAYVLSLCKTEKKILYAARHGRDRNGFLDGLKQELLLEYELVEAFREDLLLLENPSRSDLQVLEKKHFGFFFQLAAAQVMHSVALLEAFEAISVGSDDYLAKETLFCQFFSLVQADGKQRLPGYRLVEYLQDHLDEKSTEALARTINGLQSQVDSFDAILKQLNRWKKGEAIKFDSNLEKYASLLGYQVPPFVILCSNFVTIFAKQALEKVPLSQLSDEFSKYPWYRNKVAEGIRSQS